MLPTHVLSGRVRVSNLYGNNTTAIFSGQGSIYNFSLHKSLLSGDLAQFECEMEQALTCEMDCCAFYDKNGNFSDQYKDSDSDGTSDNSSDSGDESDTSKTTSKTGTTDGYTTADSNIATSQDGESAADLLHLTKEFSSATVVDKYTTLTINKDDTPFPSVTVSMPGIFKAQMLAFAASPLGQLGVQNMTATAGFSQGMLAALVLSAGCDSPAAFKLCARCATCYRPPDLSVC